MGRDRETIHAAHWKERAEAVREFLRPFHGQRLVDLGCGEGLAAGQYGSGFQEYVGFDVAPRESWRDRSTDHATFAVGDAECIPMRDGIADAILAIWVLEHLVRPERFFREVHRVLRPGGGLVLLTPNRWHYSGAAIGLIPRPVKAGLKRFLVGEEEEHATYYRCNTIRKIDVTAEAARLVPRDRRMLTYPGYLFRFPLGAASFIVERQVLARLERFRPAILASYEKRNPRRS